MHRGWLLALAFGVGVLVGVLVDPFLPTAEDLQEDRRRPHNWTEFHPEWTRGGTIVWRNASLGVDESISWASDRNTFLYAMPTAEREGRAAACPPDPDLSDTAGAWVLLSVRTCSWARHPAISCLATDVCTRLTGDAAPGGGGTIHPGEPPGEDA